jgi:hypothetical protein
MKRAICVLVLAAACGGIPHDNDTLGDSIRAYNDGVRWGRLGVAANKVPPAERGEFIADMDERQEKVKFVDYDVIDINAKTAREAKVRIKMSWYAADEGTVHETHAIQTWERRGKLWFIVGEARVRGHEMPGLPEPVAAGKHEVSKASRHSSDSEDGNGRGNIGP